MRFSKMHGLGNDFMIVDGITQNIAFTRKTICRLSDRRYGVGFDQLLLVELSERFGIDFNYRIFNANGQEVNQCGNGVRCLGSFVKIKKLTYKNIVYVSTRTRCMMLSFIRDDYIKVNMGEPDFCPARVPFKACKIENSYVLYVAGQAMLCGVVSIGNPHCIILVDNADIVNVTAIGALLSQNPRFPEETNVGFMQIVNYNHIRLRVYERGVGETQSCGSGACAAVAVGIQRGLLSEQVNVDLLGGALLINWKGVGHALYMTGSATHVYDGDISLNF
ncbi:diaminopimelate epimerase [Blochmannia endosymbiont of Colobopsis nipponica]|uniref:diaminopimelate epimerase n=1 Tax=Blochmannia endosymbiont of Colobopsis nipponica TaxID=2681987 RepID=UPI0017873822|nr:diaminopimelate epimerase [Blochmannia endosymbiont of Colobopsis nipponica]QOI10885.1 diaminopimelate epimerase [Blochmannia endosymbiont of Colobopsis nipponica]QOI10895.1 diaminopimelate epimerase [Blochmannia endosymbiont of Colobopsis nipponica]